MEIRTKEHFLDAVSVLSIVLPSFFLTVICTSLSSAFVKSPHQIAKYFILDFVILTLPIILTTTVLVNYREIILLTVIFTAALLIYICKKKIDQSPEDVDIVTQDESTKVDTSKKIHYLTSTRSIINLITVVCILAVDFDAFPWQFTKSKRYGFSLMDVGVGLYVIANGLVACEIRGKTHSIRKTFVNVLPILVIGVMRFIGTYVTHYSVNEYEYGVHWNFFITLAVTKLLSAVLMSFTKPTFRVCLTVGILVTAFHQALLASGLEDFVFSTIPRDNLITANREGIVSSLGYVGLYFIAVATGFIVQTFKSKQRTLLALLCGCFLLLIITCVLHELFNISRCLANSTYIAWVLFIAYLMMFLLCSYEQFLNSFYINQRALVYAPQLYEAINYNGLMYFLVANVLTGIVNLSIETKSVKNVYTILILIIYTLSCSLIVVLLYIKKWKLKL